MFECGVFVVGFFLVIGFWRQMDLNIVCTIWIRISSASVSASRLGRVNVVVMFVL